MRSVECLTDLLYLPRAPCLIAECPVLHVVWLFATILPAKVGVIGVLGRIAILHPRKGYSMSVIVFVPSKQFVAYPRLRCLSSRQHESLNR